VVTHGVPGFLVLGSVVLAVTGGEALYADMGHFGARPIRIAWSAIVMPALVLCYFGQGALVLRDPAALENPFFAMVPAGLFTYLLVALSSAATVIASQALISGAFSLTRQAMDLGYFPRVTIRHTAAHTEGQIYIPQINWIIAVGCLLLVLGFQKSERLASAYGIAVTGTMMLTSFVYYVVMRHTWKWPAWICVAVLVLFASFDVPFFVANTVKILDGGWVPVLIGIAFIAAMLIWSKGRTLLMEEYTRRCAEIGEALPVLETKISARVPGTGVFMSSSKDHLPPILIHVAERGRALHQQVILLTLETDLSVASIADDKRLEVEALGRGFFRAVARYGFIEAQDVPEIVRRAAAMLSIAVDPKETTFYLGRENFLATNAGAMGQVAERVFAYLQRNAAMADRDFKIPAGQVLEVGIQLDL
jgi:KUP system potassium uptake protein